MVEFPTGSVFAGHRIEAVAGRGGMGVVYRATQLDLGRTLALKVIAPELAEDPRLRDRFVNESRVTASIDHPNVIPIFYAGEEQGVLLIAMRFVVGTDLRRPVRAEGRLELGRAMRVLEQVADALDAAHVRGLVHRDVKPANVLLTAHDHAYLTDFGLTRRTASASGATGSGAFVGTLDYVAPEQIRGDRLDARADVYALGCLLFNLLTGEVPYPRETDEAKLWSHLREPPPSAAALVADLPPRLDAIIARAMSKQPEDRFPSAGDVARAGGAAAQDRAIERPERRVAEGPAAPWEGSTVSGQRPTTPAEGGSRSAEALPERRDRRRAVTLVLSRVVGGGRHRTSRSRATPSGSRTTAPTHSPGSIPVRASSCASPSRSAATPLPWPPASTRSGPRSSPTTRSSVSTSSEAQRSRRETTPVLRASSAS